VSQTYLLTCYAEVGKGTANRHSKCTRDHTVIFISLLKLTETHCMIFPNQIGVYLYNNVLSLHMFLRLCSKFKLVCYMIMLNSLQGAMRPDEALKILAVFEGKLARLKEERDNLAKAKEALELAEPGDF